ncbi:reverse transcriptase domain-containing protein [Streptomyces violaceusniger]|uniref:reverse transcriptase domain-containing protein n=1 Tax=Streptomyces violaceusniger TaxID=68280 RepID=UPI0009C3C664|nr:reverse transcriptase domain-containing protein [Streptomyces hygroscopicus]AQW56193.1 RNA-directed DNA polymerase [Streptomyces hygroscopicus]
MEAAERFRQGDENADIAHDLRVSVRSVQCWLVAWDRVRGNKGARTAGVDGHTARSIEAGQGVVDFLDGLRSQVKDRGFRPLPVRERMIPKTGGKLRRLGIATIADRVVQASLKLVLEPIFEADFHPCSYGFRPNRRAHDAMAEVRYFASRSYEWVVEGDHGLFRRELAYGPDGPSTGTSRRQARPGTGEGVPQGRHPR